MSARSDTAPASSPVRIASLVLLVALVLRLGSGFVGPLWLDEHWSLTNVLGVSFWQAVSRVSTDNNHPLISAWLWFLGDSASPWLYRLPSIIAGILVVALVRERGESLRPGLGWVLQLLCAVSYPLVLYSGEARGYSVMLLCFLLCWRLCAPQQPRDLHLTDEMAVVLLAVLGCAAHSGFLLLVPSLLLLAPFRARIIAPLLLVSAGWYLAFVMQLPPGSGGVRGYGDALAEIGTVLLSGTLPRESTLPIILGAALIGLVPLVCGVVALRELPQRIQLAGLVSIVLVPAAVLLIVEPRVVYLRYFYGSYFWGVIVLALGFQRLLSANLWLQRGIGVVALGCWCIGNLSASTELFTFGRNGYGALATLPQSVINQLRCDNSFRATASSAAAGFAVQCMSTGTVILRQREERLFELMEEGRGAALVADAPPLSGLRLFLQHPRELEELGQ